MPASTAWREFTSLPEAYNEEYVELRLTSCSDN